MGRGVSALGAVAHGCYGGAPHRPPSSQRKEIPLARALPVSCLLIVWQRCLCRWRCYSIAALHWLALFLNSRMSRCNRLAKILARGWQGIA
jgi:hypothetical protein